MVDIGVAAGTTATATLAATDEGMLAESTVAAMPVTTAGVATHAVTLAADTMADRCAAAVASTAGRTAAVAGSTVAEARTVEAEVSMVEAATEADTGKKN